MKFTVLRNSRLATDPANSQRLHEFCDAIKRLGIIIHDVHLENIESVKTGEIIDTVLCIDCEGGIIERHRLKKLTGMEYWFKDHYTGRRIMG